MKLIFDLPSLYEQRRIVAYLDGLQVKVNAAGVTVRERRGVVCVAAVRVG